MMVTRASGSRVRADRIAPPGVGAFADRRRGLDAVDGMLEAMTERACQGAAVLRHLRRHAVDGDARQGARVTEGFNWIEGDVERSRRARRT